MSTVILAIWPVSRLIEPDLLTAGGRRNNIFADPYNRLIPEVDEPWEPDLTTNLNATNPEYLRSTY
jgi:hypothetical protein